MIMTANILEIAAKNTLVEEQGGVSNSIRPVDLSS